MHQHRRYRITLVALGLTTMVGCRGTAVPTRSDKGEGDYRICAEAGQQPCRAYSASVLQVVTRPDLYNGIIVGTSGVLSLAFEGTALFATHEDFVYGTAANAIWLDLSDQEKAVLGPLHGKRVSVQGRYIAGAAGHWSAYAGRLEDRAEIRRTPTVQELQLPAPSPPDGRRQ